MQPEARVHSFFDASRFYAKYEFLSECPESLIQDVVPHPVGELSERIRAVRHWRDALLAGRRPSIIDWPSAPLGSAAWQALSELGIHRFTANQPELVDDLLRDVLQSIAGEDAKLQQAIGARLAELEAERRALEALSELNATKASARSRLRSRDAARQQASKEVIERWGRQASEADTAILENWRAKVDAWNQVYAVFGDLGELLGRGSDLSAGVLRHMGWKDVTRLQRLLAQLPQLRDVIEALGRLKDSQEEESTAETIFNLVRRLEEERQEVRTPLIPAETRGLTRSGDIPRMLPVEAVKFGHPKLRMLWHAARAERALLTYRVEGLEIERIQVEREVLEPVHGRKPRPRRGPMVVVVDTSGSMHGTPELVAKALVLEAARVAHAEKRRCLLFAFSGPGQVIEKELSLTEGGIAELLDFLGFSFWGGTDINGVLAQVIDRLRDDTWQKADVLMVSDGEWSCAPDRVRAAEAAREKGTRFHGVQVGYQGRSGLDEVCDHVHAFSDWLTLGGWGR